MPQQYGKYKIREISRTEWENFLPYSEETTVFSTNQWQEILEQVFEKKITIYGCFKKEDLSINGMMAGLSCQKCKKLWINYFTHPLFTPYSGLHFRILKKKRKNKILAEKLAITQELIKFLSDKFQYITFANLYTIKDIRTFVWNDWHIKPLYTYLLKFTDKPAMFQNFYYDLKKRIEKAEKAGLNIIELYDNSQFIKLNKMTYNKQNCKGIADDRILAKFLDLVIAKGLGKMHFVCNDNEVISGQLDILDKKARIVYVLFQVSNPKYFSLGSSSFLYWKLIEKYSKDFQYLDFCGANIPSIAKFKQGFGGELTCYYLTEFYASQSIKLAFNLYRKWRNR